MKRKAKTTWTAVLIGLAVTGLAMIRLADMQQDPIVESVDSETPTKMIASANDLQTGNPVQTQVAVDRLPSYPKFAFCNTDDGSEVQLAQFEQPVGGYNGCGDCNNGMVGGQACPKGCLNLMRRQQNFVENNSCGTDCGSGCNSGCGGLKGRFFGHQRNAIAHPVGTIGADCNGVKPMLGVDGTCRKFGHEPAWVDSTMIPWEMFSYGEYVGPHRTPHVPEYRLRVNDQLEFVYLLTRERSINPYQIYVGDQIQISSAIDASLNQKEINVLSDGSISLPLVGQVSAAGKTVGDLQRELNDRYTKFVKNPAIVVQITQSDTPLQDLLNSVDARFGNGGQSRQATVAPDGTVQLPLIGSIPAVGLSLNEIRREVNARYKSHLNGIEVTPVLLERAARFVFVVGQVTTPGRFELQGPTTVLQAIALAEGDLQGGNLRNVVVFRRDQNWRLMATRLDLAGAMHGRRPIPSDEIYLRDSDIVLVPRKPIQRISEAVDLYLTRTLFGIFPEEVIFDLDFDTGGL